LLAQDAFVKMRPMARRRFETEYTGEKNFSQVLNIYRGVMFARNLVSPPPVPVATWQ
jgi:hypothetical protein